jgi:hypothetical protein
VHCILLHSGKRMAKTDDEHAAINSERLLSIFSNNLSVKRRFNWAKNEFILIVDKLTIYPVCPIKTSFHRKADAVIWANNTVSIFFFLMKRAQQWVLF